jgi:excisionase family DNA binding protein
MSAPTPTDLISELRARKGLLTVNELAALLSAHPMTLYKWTRKGTVPFLRVGSGIRFDPRRIADWLTKRTVAA